MDRAYKAYIEALVHRNPCLQSLSNFLSKEQTRVCSIACLDISSNSAVTRVKRIDLAGLTSLLCNDQDTVVGDLQGRVLIIEDLSKEVIERLGSMLRIDPFFFAAHLDILVPKITMTRPYMVSLPSRTRRQNFVNLQYHRILEFEGVDAEKTLARDSNVPRKVKILPPTKGVRIGLVRHCCSILKTVGSDGLWVGIILVDRSLNNMYTPSNSHENNEMPFIKAQAKPFQGGYEDFLSGPLDKEGLEPTTGPQRSSLLDDLIFFWSNKLPPNFDVLKPTLLSLSYFPLKIVAAEYMSYLEVMYHSIQGFGYSPSNQLSEIEQVTTLKRNIFTLQAWSRRGIATSEKIRYILEFLEQHNESSCPDDSNTLLIEDYKYIALRVEIHSRQLESMVPATTSLIQILDSQRSLAETANITRLTYLALIFAPLTFVSGLFSMNDNIAPGGSIFWLYFIVAIPVSAMVFLVAYLYRKLMDFPTVWKAKWFLKLMKRKKMNQV